MTQLGFDTTRWLACLAPLAAGAALFACSASTDGNGNGFTSGDGSGSSSGSGGAASTSSGGVGGSFTTSSGAGGGSGGCSEAAKLIYIIGQGNNFYSFYPPTLDVTPIGILNCPQGGGFATPFSMAVDRKGVAWILFNDGRIYHVDVTNAACTATGYQAGQQGWFTFGMGFVSNTAGSEDETLYVAGYEGQGIASIDTTTLALNVVGPYDAINTAAELTGNGNAQLFGFFQGSPIIIAEIDKSNGHIISQAPQPTINIGGGWAFAFWGGSFYTFTSPNFSNSQIDRYTPGMGTETVLTNLGDNIVGAGVSTCAPTEPPE